MYRDNYPDHRAIEARSFTTIHELPMGSAPVLEGSMRRHVAMTIPLGQFRAGELGADYDRNCATSSPGLKTPRSVMMPVINSAGVTSNAGL